MRPPSATGEMIVAQESDGSMADGYTVHRKYNGAQGVEVEGHPVPNGWNGTIRTPLPMRWVQNKVLYHPHA